MARGPRADTTYEIFPKVVDATLGRDGSLFTPDRAIWTLPLLEELDRRYTGQPDLRADVGFESKLRGQLDGAPPQVVQLMAEVHYVYYVASRYNISGGKKRERIGEVLGWLPSPVAIPADLDAILDQGVGSGGPAFHNKKWPIFIQILRYFIAWKRQTAAEREAALADPWAFKSFVNSVPMEPGGQFARESLLHIVFPDSFERTFSQQDKWAQANAFGPALDIQDDDVDRRLWNIRQRLGEAYGTDFDFYETIPVRALWKPFDDPWMGFIYWAGRCRDEPQFDEWERTYKLKIGERVAEARTLLAANEPAWVDKLKQSFSSQNLTNFHAHGPFLDWVASNTALAGRLLQEFFDGPGDVIERLRNLLAELPREALSGKGTRLSIATLLVLGIDPYGYPPYRATRFELAFALTGFGSPEATADEAATYQHALGFLDELMRRGQAQGVQLRDRLDAQGAMWAVVDWPPPKDWSTLERDAFERFRKSAGPPITDTEDDETTVIEPVVETSAADGDPLEELAIRLQLDVRELHVIRDLIDAKRQVVFYGPPGTGKTYVARELAWTLAGDRSRVELVQFHPSYAYEDFVEGYRPALVNGQPGFELRPGPFRRLAGKAIADPAHLHFLIIDEMNRGNVAKVLGELYFLLEYRDEEIALQYSPGGFRLPRNIRIIATMNTADRSIALLDAALRRRFAFIPFFPDTPPIKGLLRRWLAANRPAMVWVADVVDRANERLADRNGAIGPSFFLRSDLDEHRLALVWRHEITPYLEDHFFDEPDRMAEFALDRLRGAAEATTAPPAPVQQPPAPLDVPAELPGPPPESANGAG